jgi:hypothetical protein
MVLPDFSVKKYRIASMIPSPSHHFCGHGKRLIFYSETTCNILFMEYIYVLINIER